jgi:hypothetical protein
MGNGRLGWGASSSANEENPKAHRDDDDDHQYNSTRYRVMRTLMFAQRILVRRVIKHDPPLARQCPSKRTAYTDTGPKTRTIDRDLPLQSAPSVSHLRDVREIRNDGLTARMLGWWRRTVVNLSERSVDEALEGNEESAVDFEILLDPSDPRHPEMQRRYRRLEAREDRGDTD